MAPLLSICIPTFNRSQELARQLSWLAQDIRGWEQECEIVISDNCSTDATQDVIEKWRSQFATLPFHSHRHAENVGWMKNFAWLLNYSSGKYTWIVGDDDIVQPGTVAFVIQTLQKDPELALLYLNFSGRDKATGKVMEDHWFASAPKTGAKSGKELFQYYAGRNIGSVIFITATIFRTDFVQEALYFWRKSTDNWAGIGFWTGYCATKGKVLVTTENYVECTLGVSYWLRDPKAWFGIKHADIPELYVKLQEIGYPQKFCRQQILKLLLEDLKPHNLLPTLKYFAWCFSKAPRWTIVVISRYCSAVYQTIVHRH